MSETLIHVSLCFLFGSHHWAFQLPLSYEEFNTYWKIGTFCPHMCVMCSEKMQIQSKNDGNKKRNILKNMAPRIGIQIKVHGFGTCWVLSVHSFAQWTSIKKCGVIWMYMNLYWLRVILWERDRWKRNVTWNNASYSFPWPNKINTRILHLKQ